MSPSHPPFLEIDALDATRGVSRLAVLTPFLVLAILAAGYLTLLRPQLRTFRDARARRSVAAVIPAITAHTVTTERARAAFAAIPDAQRRAIDALVPSGDDVPGLFTAIDAAAQRAGVAVTSIEASREEPLRDRPMLAGSRVLGVSVAVRNVDYAKLRALLDVLVASERLLDILSVQFTPQSLTANVRLRAYAVD